MKYKNKQNAIINNNRMNFSKKDIFDYNLQKSLIVLNYITTDK